MALILVVEDDANNFQLLQWDLEDLEHEIVHATNAADATEAADDELIALVLMDITIPARAGEPHNHRPHGLGAAATIRSRRPDLPLIAITAHGMNRMKERVVQAGCNEILEKPFDFDQLRDCLATWLPK